MRVGLRIVGALLLVAGVVFFFQGIGVIPGSFMTGRSEWAVIGAALGAAAVTILWLAGMSGTRPGP
ncbi:MAG: hypothetical protein E6J13_10535 [Chloroflexi bacterium]|nr:MAG: hypothetical protein E6J13_10535 [Chloroflexota bacterium]